jgi:hypothetical protein
MWVVARWQAWRTGRVAEVRQQKMIAHLRLLTAELGLRCYQSTHGQAPAAMEQLVPQYLKRVPVDPFNGRPMKYRPQGTNWLVYSVGQDGADNGGKPVGRSTAGATAKGDIFFDSPY